jgi:predicted ATPase/class 3 adenylate cyclase
MITLCSRCGFNNPPDMRFCGNCGARLADGFKSHEVAPDSMSVKIGAMMGVDLLERFKKAGLEASGQHRNVTVLFVDLSDYTHLSQKIDPETLYEVIQQFIEALANDVYRYEGMIDKFTGDGLMALFGAPIAHENNAELAVRAALDMQTSVADLSEKFSAELGMELKVHIGLNSGPVIAGGIGSNLMMNYTAIGDTVNLARRLEDSAAPGTIFASESVYRQTKALFNFRKSLGLTLKGVDQPVFAYQVTGAKKKPGLVRGLESLSAPMIGRDQELQLLHKTLKDLFTHKQGQLALITGEAGIGKSRLTRELKRLVDAQEVVVVEGQSLTYRRLAAYWIFLDAIRKHLGVTADTPEIHLRQRLQNRVNLVMGSRSLDALPFLEHLLSLAPSNEAAAERIQYLDAGQLRQQIFLAVRDFLVAEANSKPLILILEDLHWADQSSLDLVLFLLESTKTAPLMIVAVSRPVEEGTLSKMVIWAENNLKNRFCHLPLNTLSLDQSERLLFELLEIPELSPSLRDHIIQRAAGIPFYLEEILRMLIDNGIIRRENGVWVLSEGANISSLGVPETLEGLILARFDRLEETHRRILQVSSVIGREFSLPILQTVMHSFEKEQLIAVLSLLSERDFIQPDPNSPYTEYIFKHALMSDAIYKTMLKKDRGELHGQVGEAIEKIYTYRLDGQVDILARHYGWSPRHDRAMHYLILAGQKAYRNFENEQARQHFEQACGLLPLVEASTVQKLQIYTGLGDALVFMGEYTLARDNYSEAMHVIGAVGHESLHEEKSTLMRKLGTTYERQGEYDQALNCLNEAQSILGEVSMPEVRAQIIQDIGWIHFRRGNIDEAEKNLICALDLVVETNCYDIVASIYNRLGGVYYQKNNLDQASNFVRKSLVLREELGDLVAVARSYSNLGLLAWRKGDWEQALENFQRTVELHARLSDVEGIINLHANIGLLQTDRGNLEDAQHHLEQSLHSSIQIGHSYMQGLGYQHLGRLWLAKKDWEKSLEYSNLALKVFSDIGAKENLVDLYGLVGEAWLGLGDLDEIEKACQAAQDILNENETENQQPIAERGRIYRLLGHTARMQGDWERANQLLKVSAEQFTALGNQFELGRTLVALAQVAQARMDRVSFRLRLNEARLIFRQLGAKLELKMVDELLTQQLQST